MSRSYMVTGGTGYQGGSLVRTLLEQGNTVNALVRNPTSEKARTIEGLGAVIFKGGFDDIDVIKAAMSGVHAAFLNPFPTPMDPDLQIRHAKNVIDAAVAEKCPLVVSSAILTAQPKAWQGSGPEDFLYLYYSKKFAVEAEVRAAALKSYTILRPPYLMHNYLLPFSHFHYPELPKQGLMRHMYNDNRRFSHLDSADVGKIAAVVFANPEKYAGLEFDLGAENINADDAAAIINKVGGRNDVRTEKVAIDNFDTKTKTGLTWHYFANTQDTEFANPKQVEERFGVRLTTFAEYLEREKDLLTKSLPLPN